MQSVIDGKRQQAPPAPLRPVRRQMQQGDGVAAPGQGDRDGRLDMGQQPPVETGCCGGRRVGRQVQLARVRSWPARVRRAAGAPSA